MRKHLRLTTLIVLMVFALVSLPSIAVVLTCDNCWNDMLSNQCCSNGGGADPVYEHASDCPCNECVEKRETSGGWLSTAWERYIRPTIEEIPGATTALNIIEDAMSYDGSYPVWGITGGHGH